MQIAATTSHAALTASPRLSATIANATAPRRATAIHKSFVCGALEWLMVLMGVLPHCRKPNQTKFTFAEPCSRQKCIGRDPSFPYTPRSGPANLLQPGSHLTLQFYDSVSSLEMDTGACT